MQTNTSWLKELPVQIIRYGSPVAVVVGKDEVTIPKNMLDGFMEWVNRGEEVKKIPVKCEIRWCKEEAVGKGVWVEFDGTGTIKKEMLLCEKHHLEGKNNDEQGY